MNNLYYKAEHAPRVRELRAKIEEWQKRAGDALRLPDPASH
jgi:hypothetical protein